MRLLLASTLILGAAACAAREEPTTELTGCYDVTEGEWAVEQTVPGEDAYPVPSELGYDSVDYQIPPRIQFAGQYHRQPSATRIMVPAGALPTPHRYAFGDIIGDSLFLVFGTGHVGVDLESRLAITLGEPALLVRRTGCGAVGDYGRQPDGHEPDDAPVADRLTGRGGRDRAVRPAALRMMMG